MVKALIGLVVGLAVGLVVGAVLGMECRWQCGDCLCSTENRYKMGYQIGFQEGAETMAELVEQRATESENAWNDEGTWTIGKDTLVLAVKDAVDAAYV